MKVQRLMAYRIHQSLVEKPVKIEEFAPVWDDDKEEANGEFVVTQDFYNEMAKLYDL